MKFYGRQKELKTIDTWFKAANKGTLFTAIIGRRRIGKTRLWIEAADNKNSLYMFCLPGKFGKTLEQIDSQLYESGFTSVPQDLAGFFKAASVLLSKGKQLVFFFDEVQNLFLNGKDDLFLFQQYIDKFKRKNYPCMIVFCGSVKTLLQKILFEEHSPLYGRLDQIMELEALKFSVLQEIFIDHGIKSPAKQLRLYTMFGTNPRFYEILIQFDLLGASTRKILERGWLGMTGLFSDELNKMLLPELKKYSHVYSGILTGIAKGINDTTEIANIAGITTTSFGNYIPFLTDTLDLVKKEIPVTEKSNSKNSRYIIKDPFIYFWYRYIERNKALLEMGRTEQVTKKIETDLPNLEGKILEMVFKEKILENPPIEFDIAGSVFKNKKQIEIDFLLANQKQNKIHACEIKRGKVNKKRELNKLVNNVTQLEFKSIRLNKPEITGQILTINDLKLGFKTWI